MRCFTWFNRCRHHTWPESSRSMGLCDPGWLVGTCIAYQSEGRTRAKRDWTRHAKSLHCADNWSTVHRCFVLKCNEYNFPNIYRNNRDTFNYFGLTFYDDEVMVSIDLLPLFTAIPVDKVIVSRKNWRMAAFSTRGQK